MLSFEVNYLAVLVAGIIFQALGAAWYSPALFGTAWMRESGMTDAQLAAAKAKGMGKTYTIAFIGALITAFVLAHITQAFNARTAFDGAQIGFWMWLGFAAPIQLGSVLWDNKSTKYFAITTGYQLVALVISGALLAIWP